MSAPRTEPTPTPEAPAAPHETPAPHAPGIVARVTAWALERTLVRAFLRYSEHRGPMLADSITYRALFSLFAAVLLGFSLAALWLGGNPEVLQRLADTLNRFVPGLSDIIDVTQIGAPVGFSVVGAAAVVGLVGAAISAIGSLRNAFRVIADVTGPEPLFIWVLLRNLLVGVLFGGLVLAAAAATVLTTAGAETLAGWLGIASTSGLVRTGTRVVGVLIVLAMNTLAVAAVFRLLSGVHATRTALWLGALVGGAGLLVLQEFSALFVRGASANPLLASFAVLIALLLWINLSCQVILVAGSLIVTLTAQAADRVREKYGARTLVQRRRQVAETQLGMAATELRAAREAEAEERQRALDK